MLSIERLKSALHYDPRTGLFTRQVWRICEASMSTQPKPKITEAERTLAEYRNDRKLAEILAAKAGSAPGEAALARATGTVSTFCWTAQ